MENLSTVSEVQRTRRAWISLFYVLVLCLGIAVLLWLLGVSDSLLGNIGISLSIGLSINLAFSLLRERLEKYLPAYLVAILLTGSGLALGLLIAGSLVVGQPLFFFSDSYGTLIIGIFFGIVGFTIVSARERLADAREELARLRLYQQAQQRELLETELKLLQAQIEPHFLFNTLSNVVGLVRSDPDGAEKTLLNLSTLLRASLQRTRAESVSLGEELDIVRAYLDIQAIRMQDRLQFDIDLQDRDGSLRDQPLPPLILQPLVENAVRHGIDPCEKGGQLSIVIKRDGGTVLIVVADTGQGIHAGVGSENGTGLANVRNRLRGLYGEAASLELLENSPRGVRVELRIPGTA